MKMVCFNFPPTDGRLIYQVMDDLRCDTELLQMSCLSLQSDCASAGTQARLFLWCMKNFWRRPLVEPVCIASKPSNSSSSCCCPPSSLLSFPSPTLHLHVKCTAKHASHCWETIRTSLLHLPISRLSFLIFFSFFPPKSCSPSCSETHATRHLV